LGRRPQIRRRHHQHTGQRADAGQPLRLQYPLWRRKRHQPGRTHRRRPRWLFQHGPGQCAGRGRAPRRLGGDAGRSGPVDGGRADAERDPSGDEGQGARHRRGEVPRDRGRRQAELPGVAGAERGAHHPGGRTHRLSVCGGARRQCIVAAASRGTKGFHMRRLLPLLLAGLLVQGCAQTQDVSTADTGERLLIAQRIHTSDPSRPVAGAMAWDAEGRILAVGSAEDLRASWPDAEVLDLGDAVVVPGLIDSHGHLLNFGFSLMSADLSGARSKDEIVERLQAFAADLLEGAWLQGRGWDQNLWPEREFPTAADLDEAFPDRPVWLVRVDGHAGWGNSEAMRRAEAVDGARPLAGDWQPEGARIEREGGEATGVFVGGGARWLVERAIPERDQALREQALERALAAAVSVGLTGVHDMGVSRADLALMRRFADEGRLPLRIAAYASGDGDAFADLCDNGLYTHEGGRLWMHGIKLFADGALGSRGAALKEEYSDDPGNHGLLAREPEAYEAIVRRARECGVQVTTHAIGDRGNRTV